MADTETQTAPETQAEEVIHLTEVAQQMAKKFLAEEEDPSAKVLRVAVKSGGCSGFSYDVAIDVKKSDDIVQSYDGFEAVIDPISKQFLAGATLDYVDDVGQAGFKFENPNAKSGCGCGTSFDV